MVKNGNEKRIRAIMYVQQVEYLPESLDDLKKLLNDEANKRKEFQFSMIVHDKDVDENNKLVAPHVHVACQTASGSGLTIKQWATMFNDAPNRIEKWTGYFSNAINYQHHLTDGAVKAGKYNYPFEEAYSNFDVEAVVKATAKGVEMASKGQVNNALAELDRDITKFEALADSLIGKDKAEFLRKSASIVKYHEDRTSTSKNLEVIYIYGASGLGKTRLAKEFLKGRTYFVSGSSRDPFSGYLPKQKAVLWDDIRLNQIDAQEILRVLDEYSTNRVIGSRYRDKNLNTVDTIYLTSIFSPYRLWTDAYSKSEPYEQFRRRLKKVIKVMPEYYEVEETRERFDFPWKASQNGD